MTEGVVRRRSFNRVLLLVVAGGMAVVVPGMLGQGQVQAGAALGSAASSADVAAVTVPAFEVVSIKLDKSGGGMIRVRQTPDGYSATNISLKMLLDAAYGIREDLISGAPGWADSARFDVDAKVAGADVDALKKLTREQRGSMLRSVLADRFKMTAHTETKLLPVYELVVAKGGSKLKEATPADANNGMKGPDGIPRGGSIMRMGGGELTAQMMQIASLANLLSRQLQTTVIDKTGLSGKYDFTLNWTPEEGADSMVKGGNASQQRAEPTPDAAGPSIYTALQEQLGLKLQSAKGPVETLVIDHVDMPSEN